MIDRPPLLAVDPGREKCGVAVVTYTRQVLEREITPISQLPLRVAYYMGRYGISMVVLGDRTGAREVRDLLRQAGYQLAIEFVDEDRSSEQGRQRYLLANPETGWRRFIPVGLRTPDQPYDDYVAVILAERYMNGSRSTRLRPVRLKGK